MTRVHTTVEFAAARMDAPATTDFFELPPVCQRVDCGADAKAVLVETNWETREIHVRVLCEHHADDLLDKLEEAGYPLAREDDAWACACGQVERSKLTRCSQCGRDRKPEEP